MLVNTWSKPVPFAPRSGTKATGWDGLAEGWAVAPDVGDAAAVLIVMASWGPANATAAHANRTTPDGRIRMCRPYPVPLSRDGLPQAGRGGPRRGRYHSGP